VGGRVRLRPRQETRADRGLVVRRREGAGPAADGGEHVEVALGVDLEQAAAHQVAGQLGRLRDAPVEDARQHAEADAVVQQPDAAQGSGARLVEEVVRGVDRLVEADGRDGVGEPDEGGLDGHLLDQEREPARRAQQAAYLVGLGDEVDLLASGGADPAEEEVDGGSLQRGALGGHRQRPDPDDGLGRLPGGRQRRHDHPGVGGAVEDRLEDGAGVGGVEVEPVEDEQALASVDRAAQGAGEGVPRRGLGPQALERGHEHVVEAAQRAGVDPGGDRSGGDVAHQQGLAAARRSDDGHPP
jgi:hypothetical protein